MSQHGNEVNNDEDESASVFANNKSVLDFLIKKIPRSFTSRALYWRATNANQLLQVYCRRNA